MPTFLSADEFEAVVEIALETLPPNLAKLVENVVITIEDEPTEDDLEALGDDASEDELLGIYRGVALTERAFGEQPIVPDEIAIFRGPIERVSASRTEAINEVRETVIHELGHYFGLDEDELP